MRKRNIYLEERQAAAYDDLAADLDALDASFGIAVDDPPPPQRGQDARARHLETVWRSCPSR